MELNVVDLTKQYGNNIALDHIKMSLHPGIYGLLGPNGSGKSTFMNLLAQTIVPSDGKILWGDTDIREMGSDYCKLLGYVPQYQAMYNAFTVAEYMSYIAILKGVRKEIKDEECSKWIETVGLQEFSRKKIKSLSGGMRQRLLIAQAFLGEPQLVLMDEPTVGLDPAQREKIRCVIKNNADKRIIIIASHIVADVDYLADYVIFLHKGYIEMHGTKEELLSEAQQKFSRREICTIEDLYVQLYGGR